MIIIVLTIVAALAAWTGGQVAIKSRRHLNIAMNITAGLVLGLVTFDLLPEIFEGSVKSGSQIIWPMVLLAFGFISFHAAEKFALMHSHDEASYRPHQHPALGTARALALAAHSFMDGLSIGVAFQVNPTVGYAVALAVIGHRFADGLDTANFMIFHGNKMPRIKQLLFLVMVMPVIGGLASLVLTFSETTLTLYLGFFAGVLLYIAASNILPQAHTHDKNTGVSGLIYLLIGMSLMFLLSQLV